MKKFLPSLSHNLFNYLQNVWSAMSLSLLVLDEKKLPISINFQKKRLSPVYTCQYNFIQKFANFKTLLWKDHKGIKDRGLSFGMVPTHNHILKAKNLNLFGS